jgi:hypothetical protein
MISVVALIAIAAFVIPTTPNLAYPNKVQDCSRCHGPSSGTYYDDIMSIAISKTTLSTGEGYTVGIDIVIQTDITKRETGYAIEDLGSGAFVAYLDSTVVQSHFDQEMTAPSVAGTYNYRVWGESGPATSDGKTDYDDYTITVSVPSNGPPTLTPLSNRQVNAGASSPFSASATDPDGDGLRYTWSFGDGTALVVGNPVSHTYAKAGTYTYRVYVDDLHAHNVTSSAAASVAFNLNLVAGWNLIGVPLVGYGYRASTLGLGPGDQVIAWDSATQTYKPYISGLPVNDFDIVPSSGYWIYTSSAKTLHLFGTVPTTASATITVPAGGGWALLSLVGVNSVLHASDLSSRFTGGTPTTVVMWNAAPQTYTTHITGLPMNNFALDPGMGFWVYFSGSGVLSYTP